MTIPARATSAVFELPTIDDVVVEEPETVTVAVTADGPLPSGVRRPSGVRATGTIVDDDEAAVTVTASDPAPEGGSGHVHAVSVRSGVVGGAADLEHHGRDGYRGRRLRGGHRRSRR